MKVCMLAYTEYERDNRVRRYAEALAKRGDQVDIISLEGSHARSGNGEVGAVKVYEIQKRDLNERGVWSYARRQLSFLARSSALLTRLHHRNAYDLVHVHNIPDFLVFAAWYPRMTGSAIILDIHDIVPELFANKFKSRLSKLYVGMLRKMEKASARFADHVIVSNDLWRETLVARSVRSADCSVFINHVDTEVFKRKTRSRRDGHFVVLFPGTFQWHQGLDIGIRAFAKFKEEVGDAEFHLYGGGNLTIESELKELVRELRLEGAVKFCGAVSLDQMAEVMANADLGVVPKRADAFGNEAYSTKIMEFMSQGIPVVASETKIDAYYFREGVVHFFKSGDVDGMTRAMLDIARDGNLRESLVQSGYDYVEQNCWDVKKKEYFNLVDSLRKLHHGEAGSGLQEGTS
jgi:glycosyltransferase involved in cell wall biosynthesis